MKRAPWALGHKHQHWRRVRFDHGGVRDVDTAAQGVGGPRTALHAPAAPAPTAKITWKMSAAIDSDDEEQMETSDDDEGSGSSEGEEESDEGESDEESGGEARRKKRNKRRSQQQGRPASRFF